MQTAFFFSWFFATFEALAHAGIACWMIKSRQSKVGHFVVPATFCTQPARLRICVAKTAVFHDKKRRPQSDCRGILGTKKCQYSNWINGKAEAAEPKVVPLGLICASKKRWTFEWVLRQHYSLYGAGLLILDISQIYAWNQLDVTTRKVFVSFCFHFSGSLEPAQEIR